MPLVGGGGAGNTQGSNPAGTGTSLNYVGDHAYGYSGSVDVDNTETTLLRFATGGLYIVGSWTYQGFEPTGDDYKFTVILDNQEVSAILFPGVSNISGIVQDNINILIPPYTEVTFTAQNITDTTANLVGVTFSGRVYA